MDILFDDEDYDFFTQPFTQQEEENDRVDDDGDDSVLLEQNEDEDEDEDENGSLDSETIFKDIDRISPSVMNNEKEEANNLEESQRSAGDEVVYKNLSVQSTYESSSERAKVVQVTEEENSSSDRQQQWQPSSTSYEEEDDEENDTTETVPEPSSHYYSNATEVLGGSTALTTGSHNVLVFDNTTNSNPEEKNNSDNKEKDQGVFEFTDDDDDSYTRQNSTAHTQTNTEIQTMFTKCPNTPSSGAKKKPKPKTPSLVMDLERRNFSPERPPAHYQEKKEEDEEESLQSKDTSLREKKTVEEESNKKEKDSSQKDQPDDSNRNLDSLSTDKKDEEPTIVEKDGDEVDDENDDEETIDEELTSASNHSQEDEQELESTKIHESSSNEHESLLEEKDSESDEIINELTDQLTSTKEELQLKNKELTCIRKELETLQEKLDSLMDTLHERTGELAQKDQKALSLKNKVSQLKSFAKSKKKDLIETKKELKSVNSQIKKWKSSSKETKKESDEKVVEIKKAKTEIKRLKSLLQKKDQDLKHQKKENVSLKTRFDAVRRLLHLEGGEPSVPQEQQQAQQSEDTIDSVSIQSSSEDRQDGKDADDDFTLSSLDYDDNGDGLSESDDEEEEQDDDFLSESDDDDDDDSLLDESDDSDQEETETEELNLDLPPPEINETYNSGKKNELTGQNKWLTYNSAKACAKVMKLYLKSERSFNAGLWNPIWNVLKNQGVGAISWTYGRNPNPLGETWLYQVPKSRGVKAGVEGKDYFTDQSNVVLKIVHQVRSISDNFLSLKEIALLEEACGGSSASNMISNSTSTNSVANDRSSKRKRIVEDEDDFIIGSQYDRVLDANIDQEEDEGEGVETEDTEEVDLDLVLDDLDSGNQNNNLCGNYKWLTYNSSKACARVMKTFLSTRESTTFNAGLWNPIWNILKNQGVGDISWTYGRNPNPLGDTWVYQVPKSRGVKAGVEGKDYFTDQSNVVLKIVHQVRSISDKFLSLKEIALLEEACGGSSASNMISNSTSTKNTGNDRSSKRRNRGSRDLSLSCTNSITPVKKKRKTTQTTAKPTSTLKKKKLTPNKNKVASMSFANNISSSSKNDKKNNSTTKSSSHDKIVSKEGIARLSNFRKQAQQQKEKSTKPPRSEKQNKNVGNRINHDLNTIIASSDTSLKSIDSTSSSSSLPLKNLMFLCSGIPKLAEYEKKIKKLGGRLVLQIHDRVLSNRHYYNRKVYFLSKPECRNKIKYIFASAVGLPMLHFTWIDEMYKRTKEHRDSNGKIPLPQVNDSDLFNQKRLPLGQCSFSGSFPLQKARHAGSWLPPGVSLNCSRPIFCGMPVCMALESSEKENDWIAVARVLGAKPIQGNLLSRKISDGLVVFVDSFSLPPHSTAIPERVSKILSICKPYEVTVLDLSYIVQCIISRERLDYDTNGARYLIPLNYRLDPKQLYQTRVQTGNTLIRYEVGDTVKLKGENSPTFGKIRRIEMENRRTRVNVLLMGGKNGNILYRSSEFATMTVDASQIDSNLIVLESKGYRCIDYGSGGKDGMFMLKKSS